MPNNWNNGGWYSFDHGNIHFVMISTEHSLELTSPQYKWLVEDLALTSRKLTPWLIVLGHRPMYTSMSYYNADYVDSFYIT
eukprot:UN15598